MHFPPELGGRGGIQDDRLHQHRGIFEAIRDGAPELAEVRPCPSFSSDWMNDIREYLKQRDAAGEPAAAR